MRAWDSVPFSDQIAVITGATQGIGEAAARLLSQRGLAGAVLAGRQAQRGEALARELSGQGTPAFFVPADLTSHEQTVRIMDVCEERFGRVDVLLNCAGWAPRATLEETTPELWEKIFAVNVKAPFFLCQAAAALMTRQGLGGSIVNVVSKSSYGGEVMLCPYSISKGALATLTRNLAHSLLSRRIRVNGVNLGWTDTPGEHAQQASQGRGPEWLAGAEASRPFGRLLKAEDVARALAFLAGPESSLMTGTLMDLDQIVAGCSGPWQR